VNDTLHTIRPEVEAFVAEVRARLADLSDDERDELLGGLEADLSEQLADGAGIDALGDPAAYAAELRAAAGLPEQPRTRRSWLPARRPGDLGTDLDRMRAWFLDTVERRPWSVQAWVVLEAMRPAWWVLRAWLAVTFVDQLAGEWEYVTLLPTLGAPLLGEAVLLGAVVVSVLVGLGRLWPGSGPERPLLARLVLLGVNVAVLLLALTFTLPSQHGDRWDDWRGFDRGLRQGANQPGLRLGGDEVRNIFVYSSDGKLISGAQLFRGNGEPLGIRPVDAHTGRGVERTVGCGWFNGTSQLFNVFPLAERTQRRGSCLEDGERRDAGPVADPEPPFAVVPPVTSPVPTATPETPETPEKPEKPGKAGNPDGSGNPAR
jgi:hypothetical protein